MEAPNTITDNAAPSSSKVFNVRDHGAAGDGQALDTGAVQRALDACGEAGGGRVLLSPGTYLCATLHLRSGVELHLEEGAVLLGTPDKDAYLGPRGEGNRWLHALILGEDVQGVAFRGRGVIHGNNVRDPRGEEGMRGPHTILLRGCRDVRLEDITIRHSANYAFLFYACEQVRVEAVTFEGGWDGVHFRDLDGKWNRDVRISGCRFYTGDDSIAGACIEDAVIENCLINSSCNGVRLIGPARRWSMSNCRFFGPGLYPHITQGRHNMLAGLLLHPSAWDPWPGPLEEVRFHDIEMENVQAAFHITLLPGNTGEAIAIERLKATLCGAGQTASSVESWGEEPFGQVSLRDIEIVADGGGGEEAARLPIEMPGKGVRRLPAWGFYARRVASLSMERVRLAARAPDARRALLLDAVERLQWDDGASDEGQAPAPPHLEGVAAETGMRAPPIARA